MINTAQDLYQYFIDGIKKEYTGTVTVGTFERIYNVAQSEWVASNVSMREGIELTEKQIDDLAVLRREHVFTFSSTASPKTIFPLPDGITPDVNGNIADRFYRKLSIRFILSYGNANECGLTGLSEEIEPKIMRSDMKAYAKTSPYRKPTDARIYYERVQDNINLYTGASTGTTGHQMILEYLTTPLDVNIVTNVYTKFQDYQLIEIVNICIRKYLERTRDARYNSTTNEQAINQVNKI